MLLMILNTERIIVSVKNSLILCSSSLIPSVFPFLVVSSIFVNYSEKRFFNPFSIILKFLFGTSSVSCAALLPGMICGYPIGASCTCELYKNHLISKSESESLIAFSNNSGPLFIVGTIGIGLLNSAKKGIMLYAIHILSAIICGILLKPFTKPCKNTMQIMTKSASKKITDCIGDATVAILKICGFVVVFAVIIELISPITSLMPKYLGCLVSSFLELTNASFEITEHIENERMCLVLLSGTLGWSGLSVHMQVKSILGNLDLSLKKYYLSKLFSSIISMVMSYFIFYEKSIINFELNLYISIFVMIIIFYLTVRNMKSKFILKHKKG